MLHHFEQLPAQVCDIANSLAHALAEKRRLHVRGVSGNEHATDTPPLRNQRMEAIAGLAPQLAIVRSQPALEQFPRTFRRFRVARILAAIEADLPTSMIAGADH